MAIFNGYVKLPEGTNCPETDCAMCSDSQCCKRRAAADHSAAERHHPDGGQGAAQWDAPTYASTDDSLDAV